MKEPFKNKHKENRMLRGASLIRPKKQRKWRKIKINSTGITNSKIEKEGCWIDSSKKNKKNRRLKPRINR